MRVLIDAYTTLNPSITRVSVVTHEGVVTEDLLDSTDTDYRYYEFAIPISDFTENDGNGNFNIDIDKFQHVVSERIVNSQPVSGLCAYMGKLNLEWDLNIQPPKPETREEASTDSMKLAYGE